MSQETEFWKITDEIGNLLVSAPVALKAGENETHQILFSANKAVGIEAGDILYVTSPFGTPMYKVEVSDAPMVEGEADVMISSQVIGVS